MTEGKKPLYRILSWLLVLLMFVGLLPVMPAAAETSEQTESTEVTEPTESTEPTEPVKLTLEELMEKFPEGKFWNGGDPDGWTETPCTHHGSCGKYGWDGWCGCNSFMGQSIQCMGFAEKLGYDATGYSPREDANGWKTVYYASSINTVKPGDIIRRSGHSMYVTAVDGNTVTIADCNAKNKSCNIRWGVTKTKSELKSGFEYLRVAPSELVPGYLGKCEDYPANGTVLLNADTVLRTHPCSQEAYEKSQDVAAVEAYTELTVTGVCQNTEDQYWYKVKWGEKNCYVPAEAVGSFTADFGNVTVDDVSAPANTKKGSGFPIKGTITSDTLPLTLVGAYIFEGSAVTDAPYMTSEDSAVQNLTYSIYGSSVDSNLTFGKLPLGEYTYLLTAAVTNYYVGEAGIVSQQQVIRLHQNTFTVSSSLPCSHSYTQTITAAGCVEDGMITYTCTKCGFAYTQTIFAIGGLSRAHQYGDWVITIPATMTAAGEQQKVCTQCGNEVCQEIPVLAGEVEEWGVVLDGDLQVNFRMRLQEDASVVVTVAEDTFNYDLDIAAYNAENDTYQLSVPVAAAQMADAIQVQILSGEEVSVKESYTVLQYAQEVLADESLSSCHGLIREMLNYGAAAQIYFDHDTENLVNADITDTGAEEIPAVWEQAVELSGKAEGIHFYGATLLYRDKIAVRYYFTVSGEIGDFVFRSGDAEYTPVQKDGLWYVELPGILIQDLDEGLTLAVNDSLLVTYCPMNYLVRMNQKGTEKAKALLKAMYNYHLAAEAYLETE